MRKKSPRQYKADSEEKCKNMIKNDIFMLDHQLGQTDG